MIKYLGFSGETEYRDSCLDSVGLTSAPAPATDKIELYATVPTPGIHPAVAARMIATLNDGGGDRAGVNIVPGWNKPEYSQMALWLTDDYHARRYEPTKDYIRITRTLWRSCISWTTASASRPCRAISQWYVPGSHPKASALRRDIGISGLLMTFTDYVYKGPDVAGALC